MDNIRWFPFIGWQPVPDYAVEDLDLDPRKEWEMFGIEWLMFALCWKFREVTYDE